MAFSSSSWSFTSFFMILQLICSGSLHANGCYTSIISFGDSLADTGNLKQLADRSGMFISTFQPPYGQNFIDQSTGRCSNGRLMIDFLAESLGLPFIPPYVHDKESDDVAVLGQGINYAVAGCTALNRTVLEPRGTINFQTNASLEIQLAWFKHSLRSLCSTTSDCKKIVESSLFLVGEIGGNDYNYPIMFGQPVEEVYSLVPLVIDIIISAVNELIDLGAKTLVVPGNFPIGCATTYLTLCESKRAEDYDDIGCLISLNKFSEYHNELLQTKLNHVRELHPNVIIIYADYYNAAMQIYRSPQKFGFTNGAMKSCCGGGGKYNYDMWKLCGLPSATVCDDPDTFANWDGVHFTEAAYKILAESLFQGPYTTPQFNSICPTLTSDVGVGLLSSV